MNKTLLILIVIFGLWSCSGSKSSKLTDEIKAKKEQVMKAHDEVMPKMGELRKAARTLDTLVVSASFEGDSLLAKKIAERLVRANENMMDWMRAYIPDSLGNDVDILSYYESERVKAEIVKNDMLNALDSAQSFLQSVAQ